MAAPSNPAGKGLNGKIGPVPVKVALFVAVALVVYLYMRHRAKTTPTSQGSESAPQGVESGSPFQGQGDATGGGSSGGTGDHVPAGGNSGVAPDYAPPPSQQPFNFYFSSVPDGSGGGNTSTPAQTTIASSSAPATSFPVETSIQQAADQFAYLAANPVKLQGFNPGNYEAPEPGPNSVGTVEPQGPQRVALPDSVSGSYRPAPIPAKAPPPRSSPPPVYRSGVGAYGGKSLL